jgi:hypothetical protein
MKESPENPTSNALGSGLQPLQVEQAVERSGYPLQTIVAQRLLNNFHVTEEWSFVDRSDGKHRSLDLFAYKQLTNNPVIRPITPAMGLVR